MRAATVVTKPDPKKPGARVPMGYGFVEFRSSADAKTALLRMQHSRLDDHSLELKLSSRQSASDSRTKNSRVTSDAQVANHKPASTLMVRNLPFEANKKEVQELFGAFGQLKQVRLPKRAQGSHRGFAFVEFTTKQEATKAMQALQSTHLYGRHLVLQYADVGMSVDGLREKMRTQLASEALPTLAAAPSEKNKGFKDVVDALIL